MVFPHGKLNWQSKQMIFNLHNYFRLRKRDPSSEEYQEDANVNNLTATATGLSCRTITKIVAQGKSLQNIDGQVLFATTEKQRKTVPKKRTPMDCFIEGLIRRRVLQAGTEIKKPLSLIVIQKILKQEDILKCSHEYLRTLILKIGFKHTTKKRILYENIKVAKHRWTYINTIKKYRDEGRDIIYLDETYFSLDKGKLTSWETDDETAGVIYYTGKGHGLITLHAGGSKGFLDNTLLMIKTLNIRNCDMNYNVFSKWVKEQLLPQLPEKCAVVMDNAEYHISTENPQELDNLLSEKGHELLRLPLGHQELNPLELVWRDLKQGAYINDQLFYDLDTMQSELLRVFGAYPQEKWDDSIEYVQKIETEYFLYKDVFEDLIKDLQTDEETIPEGYEGTSYNMNEDE